MAIVLEDILSDSSVHISKAPSYKPRINEWRLDIAIKYKKTVCHQHVYSCTPAGRSNPCLYLSQVCLLLRVESIFKYEIFQVKQVCNESVVTFDVTFMINIALLQ